MSTWKERLSARAAERERKRAERGPVTTCREVTKALCWLPPGWTGTSWRHERSSDTWHHVEERRSVIGRIGWLVITETLDIPERESANSR